MISTKMNLAIGAADQALIPPAGNVKRPKKDNAPRVEPLVGSYTELERRWDGH
jgi:hypothetical protein